MVDMFVNKMCCCCSNSRCARQIKIIKIKNCITYKCNEYIKNKNKIIPYEEPLTITAERDYIVKKEM